MAKLSRKELEEYDANPYTRGHDTYYCCPLDACADKPIDRAHRRLGVDNRDGRWHCFRCDARGVLSDFGEEDKARSREDDDLRRRFGI